jgi:actin-like ATPase involved in cell morphogenesis
VATASIGIDFGTSTTLVSIRVGDTLPVIIPIGRNGQTSWMPSVAGIKDDTFVAGEDAEDLPNPIRSVKSRLTSRDETGGKEKLPTVELIREILAVALARAQAVRGEVAEIGNVYMGCPAEWDGTQRRALADIARQLGIDVDLGEIIDEPVAAGLAWIEEQWQDGVDVRGRIVIFDAGGGTLDVAVLEADVSPAGDRRMVVLGAHSLTESGDAVDVAIARYLVQRETGEDVTRDDVVDDLSLMMHARSLKEQLSGALVATVANDSAYIDSAKDLELTSDELAEVVRQQVQTSIRLVEKTLRTSMYRGSNPKLPSQVRLIDEKVLFGEVDHVVLVGGMSRLPSFRRALSEKFAKSEIHEVLNPQEVVALGLTYGDKLQSLNLPRPPVNFVLSGGGVKTLLYQAFTPLYSWRDEITHDGLSKDFSFGGSPLKDAELTCESPTRDNRRLSLVLAIKHEHGTDPRLRMWWDPDNDWQEVDRTQLPNFPEFVAELDWRPDRGQVDELHGFVDYREYFRQFDDRDDYKVSYFVGDKMHLAGATSDGKIVLYADGRLLIRTSRVGFGTHEVVLRILYWPLKSDTREKSGRERLKVVPLTEAPEISQSDVGMVIPETATKGIPPGGGGAAVTDLSCDEAYGFERDFVSRTFYDQSSIGILMSEAHQAIATLMSDYGLTGQDISSEIDLSPNGDGIDFFMITEDDIPKVVLIRTIPSWVPIRGQVAHLESMIEATKLLAQRKSKSGLKGVDRERYPSLKSALKKDAEFHCWLVMVANDGEIVETGDYFSGKLNPLVDSAEVFLRSGVIERYCREVDDVQTDVVFPVDNSDFYQHQSANGDRVVSMLLPADVYVQGTYPLGVELFRLNPRLFLSKKAGPNKAMLETLGSSEAERFHLLNNGITGVCEEISVLQEADKSLVSVKGLQIVNGCQTTETIWAWARRTSDPSRVLVPLRIVRGGSDEALARRISVTTNSQSAVAAADLVAGDDIQLRVKRALESEKIFYEARRGEWRRISAAQRTHLAGHPYGFLAEGIVQLNLREFGQALLSVTGRPNQAKEQIAGLFKESNRVQYRELFDESWNDNSQIALVALLYAYLRDVTNWNKDEKLRQLAGLGRFYVLFLVYDYLRAVANDVLDDEEKIDGESLILPDASRELMEAFDPSEISRLANEAVGALKWVMDNTPEIDGYRALLRQGIHKNSISERFDEAVGIVED